MGKSHHYRRASLGDILLSITCVSVAIIGLVQLVIYTNWATPRLTIPDTYVRHFDIDDNTLPRELSLGMRDINKMRQAIYVISTYGLPFTLLYEDAAPLQIGEGTLYDHFVRTNYTPQLCYYGRTHIVTIHREKYNMPPVVCTDSPDRNNEFIHIVQCVF
jgi:hypothetical protein